MKLVKTTTFPYISNKEFLNTNFLYTLMKPDNSFAHITKNYFIILKTKSNFIFRAATNAVMHAATS